MDDDLERMAGRTRTESAELRRRELQQRSLPWRQRVLAMISNGWTWMVVALLVVVVLMTTGQKP